MPDIILSLSSQNDVNKMMIYNSFQYVLQIYRSVYLQYILFLCISSKGMIYVSIYFPLCLEISCYNIGMALISPGSWLFIIRILNNYLINAADRWLSERITKNIHP